MNKLFVFAVIASIVVASLASVISLKEDGEIPQESISNIRPKREVTCKSVSSIPNNPASYYEACRAHCISNGNKGGNCVGVNCRCY